MITGGQSSGKSLHAEQRALDLCPTPIYVATARVDPADAEMRERIAKHRERRGPEWTTIEEPVKLGSLTLPSGSVVLIDCVTLWCTNLFFDLDCDPDATLRAARAEFDRLTTAATSATSTAATFIIVTNEIGLGGVSDSAMQRRFADLQGRINQHIAARADEVTMVVSGIPVKIK